MRNVEAIQAYPSDIVLHSKVASRIDLIGRTVNRFVLEGAS